MSVKPRLGMNMAWCAVTLAAIITALPAQAEIVTGSERPAASRSRDAAAEARDRARTQRGNDGPVVPLSTIADELDDGPFGGRPTGAATDVRSRARTYQQQSDDGHRTTGPSGGTVFDTERMSIDPDSNRGRVKSNLDRARAYSQGESLGVTGSRFGGQENLPLVDCGQVDNTTGRIGDEVSGAVMTIVRGNKAMKVRCK